MAEDNFLNFKVFSEIRNLFPNIKVIVLNKNEIDRIPNLVDGEAITDSQLDKNPNSRVSGNLFDESNTIHEDVPLDFNEVLDNEINKLDQEYKEKKGKDPTVSAAGQNSSISDGNATDCLFINHPKSGGTESKRPTAEQNTPLNEELRILSLTHNPIKKFEDFSNILQYKNLSILKLHETPFVKTTSKNPAFVDESGIIVERHPKKKLRSGLETKKTSGQKSSQGQKSNNFRKVAEPIRFKKDKRWFEELITDLEKRVKYEVRAAILGDVDEANSTRGSQKAKVSKQKKGTEPKEATDTPTDNPIFMTQFDQNESNSRPSTAKSSSTIKSYDSTITINGIKSDISELSETITDMSCLDGSLYSENNRNLKTPPLPMPDNVSRLRLMLNKKNMVGETFKQITNQQTNQRMVTNNEIKTFLYKPEEFNKPNTAKALMVRDKIEKDNKTEDVINRTLGRLKVDTVLEDEALSVGDEKLDEEKFEKLKAEYWKLRREINRE